MRFDIIFTCSPFELVSFDYINGILIYVNKQQQYLLSVRYVVASTEYIFLDARRATNHCVRFWVPSGCLHMPRACDIRRLWASISSTLT